MSEQLSKPERKPFSIDKDNLASFMKAVIYGSLVIFIIVLAVYFSNFHNGFSDKQEVWGNFGDFLGGVLNPIFGLFGLVALLITISLQTKELEATHIELRRSAHAQELMEKTAKEQALTMERQRFETTFFALLEQHNKLHEAITSPNENDAHKRSNLARLSELVLSQHNLSDAKLRLSSYFELTGYYFRTLFQLLKLIALSVPGNTTGPSFDLKNIYNVDLSENEKMYSDIVRGFISNEVAQIIAIHCAVDEEKEHTWTYKCLVERYQLLAHMKPYSGTQESPKSLDEARRHYQNAFGVN